MQEKLITKTLTFLSLARDNEKFSFVLQICLKILKREGKTFKSVIMHNKL